MPYDNICLPTMVCRLPHARVDQLVAYDHSSGSIQLCPGIPCELKAIYRTMWDHDPVDLISMAADRGPFIDQSQSLTLAIRAPTSEYLVCHTNIRCLLSLAYILRFSKPLCYMPGSLV